MNTQKKRILPVKCDPDNRLRRVPVEELKRFQGNLKTLHSAQYEKLRASMDKYGFFAPVFVWGTLICDGHQRLNVLEREGWDVEGGIPVVEIEASDEKDAAEKLLLLSSTYGKIEPQGLYEFTSEHEIDLREFELPDLPDFDLGVFAAEFYEGADGEHVEDPGAQMDRAEELREKWQVGPGQLWALDRHRLIVGDCTDAAVVERVMGGDPADLLHADPPYGIGIVRAKGLAATGRVGGSKPFGSTSGATRKSSTGFDRARLGSVQRGPKSKNQIIQSNLYPEIEGDDKPFDPAHLLGGAPVVIMWGANYYADKLPISSCWLCWDKREDITRNSFADGELAWVSKAGPCRVFHHLWNGLHKGSQHGERRSHPTEKPVALFEEIGKMFCAQGVWYDPYCGTGAQIIAAERVGAKCRAIEISPLYVAVSLERWHQATGKTPILEPDAKGA